ncbi:hypothetical protein [Frankia sp. AiPs1]
MGVRGLLGRDLLGRDRPGRDRPGRDRFAVQPHSRTAPEGRPRSVERLPTQRAAVECAVRPAWAVGSLPPSVARVAARTRLSAELLAALLEVDGRSRATLDDMERADAIADALLARRRLRASQQGASQQGAEFARAV